MVSLKHERPPSRPLSPVSRSEGARSDTRAISTRPPSLARSYQPSIENKPDMSDKDDRGRVPEKAQNEGDGYAIWTRVATVASTLTVSVSKAWTTNINTFSGEETPPGQESRLTRAMKAYHLEKARDPSDLPSWLFEVHERQNPPEVVAVVEPPRARGLRDVYDASPGVQAGVQGQQRSSTPWQPSKAADRLKAMRDAKKITSTGGNFEQDEGGDKRQVWTREQTTARVGVSRPAMGRRV